MEIFTQLVLSGILLGGVYALAALGLNLIFGVAKVINFAHGEFLMLGMYFAWYLFVGFGVLTFLGPYAGPIVSAIVAGVIVFVVGFYFHKFLLSYVTGFRTAQMEGEGHYAQLILTLGISLVLSNGGLILFGSMPISIRTPLASSAWEIALWGDLSLFVNKARLVSGIIAVLAAVAMYLFITRTTLGKALRAAADNPTASMYVGIDVDRGHRIAFGLGTAITAVAGGLLATFYPFQPYVGFEFLIIMYAGVVLGGLGSVAGAFWGGMVIGLVQQLSTMVLPIQLQNTAIFLAFLLIVFFMPYGLFGKNTERA